MSERSSVALTANAPDAAMAAITWRAVGIESCLNPAVAVSISTRAAARPATGGCAIGAGSVVDPPDEQANVRRTIAPNTRHRDSETQRIKFPLSLCASVARTVIGIWSLGFGVWDLCTFRARRPAA